MSASNIVADILRAVDTDGVPADARIVHIESGAHDDPPGGAMTYIEFSSGHIVGRGHPAALTEGDEWALRALLAFRRHMAGRAERCAS